MADHRQDSRDGNRDHSSSIFSNDDASSDRWRGDPDSRDDRGFLSKAGDEVRSWFGDEEAEHRREDDARRWEREHGETGRYQGGEHDDQWRGGPVDEDRSYVGTGNHARHYESSRFQRGQDRDDQGGWERASYGQARQPAGQDPQASKYGQGRYGQSSFGDGNHGSTRDGGPGYGRSDPSQSGRYGQVGQASFGQHRHGDRDQAESGHYGSEQDYGRAGRASGSGQSDQGSRFGGSPHDESYRRWRDQQMESLDREYEEYCRHRQSQFEQDFHGFRQTRAGQQGGQTGPGQMSAGRTDTAEAKASGQTSGQQTLGETAPTGGAPSAMTGSGEATTTSKDGTSKTGKTS